MIAFLRGKIVEKKSEQLILDVQGVGYQVWIPRTTFEQLPTVGEAITINTYHHIVDNDQNLFGFYEPADKELFQLLITVKNIGPKLGLAIISGMSGAEIMEAISQHNIAALSSISGIGKKTAERMILELKDKLDTLSAEFRYNTEAAEPASELKAEALSALQSLGYRKKEAQKAINRTLKQQDSFDSVTELVKSALAEFNR